jgi:phospholipid/cholesterol/gamma-HCH transport system permease protein
VEHDQSLVLELRGSVTFPEAARLWSDLCRAAASLAPERAARVDLSGVERMDGAAMAVLVHATDALRARGVDARLEGASNEVAELVRVYQSGDATVSAPPARPGLLLRVGHATHAALGELVAGLAFMGAVVAAAGQVLRHPRTVNWRDTRPLMERVGANAVPIVLAINYLVGLVTAYESAVQLRRFGATIYVADLVGLSIARELGPIMTAIIVTGRSGAAYAAELGTMVVSEEIDALRALGVDPLRYLVFPRVVSLFFMLPLLTVVADATGMLGGLTVAITSLDLSPTAFFAEMKTIVFVRDIAWGLLKSAAFACAIGLISCQQGLAAGGGAEGVGRRTTASVVTTLFALIAIDAVFTALFHRGRT